MHLTEYRKKKKLSQVKFGLLLNPPASQSLVWQWECGKTRITLDYAIEIERLTKRKVSCEDCSRMFKSKETDPSGGSDVR